MSKLKTKHAGLYGKSANLPLVGKVQLDEEGVTIKDIPEEFALEIIENSEEWVLVDDEGNKLTNDPVEDEFDIEEFKLKLKSMELKDLVELAVNAEYPISEFEKYKKSKQAMIVYLTKKATS